jgi:hydrogenase nickel incorporation protein HypA/HybF
MHEFSITQNVLEIALRHAEKAGARRITRLNLVVGELSSIIDDSVQFYWDIVARDTIAEGSQLCFERIPGSLRCLGCDNVFSLNGRDYTCPACGGSQVVVVGGDQFRLESIEVE